MTDLDERINSNDLIYRYKCKTADAKFDEFDNALGITNKIRDGKTDLSDVKYNREKFKSYLEEIKKETVNTNRKSKKTLCTILKCSIKQKMKLLNFMMIILQRLKQKLKQIKEQAKNINTHTNASKITNRSCASKSWE